MSFLWNLNSLYYHYKGENIFYKFIIKKSNCKNPYEKSQYSFWKCNHLISNFLIAVSFSKFLFQEIANAISKDSLSSKINNIN